jgi:hypothetical protein
MLRINSALTVLCATLALSTGVPTVAASQSLAAVPVNARVRVDLPGGERSFLRRERAQSVTGTVETIRGDTLFMAVGSGAALVRIPAGSIRGVFVSKGRPARWRAALEGAVLPALVAGALSAAGSSIRRKDGDPSPGRMAATSAGWAAASGALLSAWSPKERWRAVPLSSSDARVVQVTDINR